MGVSTSIGLDKARKVYIFFFVLSVSQNVTLMIYEGSYGER